MKSDAKKITEWLKTARGQLDGILKMVEDDRYCIDISHQLMATQALIRKVNKTILHDHIDHCVRASMVSGDISDIDKKLDEVDRVLDMLLK